MNESKTNIFNVLEEAWMQVLHCQNEPQEQSNFLEHGGNSFNAALLVSKLRRECKIDVTIADVFRNPVYCNLRTVIQESQTINDHTSQTSPLCRKPFPLSSFQQHIVNLQQTYPKSTAYVETIACYSSTCVEPENVLKSLIGRHPMLTSKVQMSGSKTCTMTITDETTLEIESEKLDRSDNTLEYLTASIPVIDVILCPLYKFRHLIISSNESLFVLHVHRVIADDVTMRSFAQDLQAILNGELKESQLHSRHYSEYVNDERIYYASEQHKVDRMFWKTTFSTLPCDSSLAIQPKLADNQTITDVYKAREKIWYLSKDIVNEIISYCKVLGVTEFQYFLACASLALQRYLGADDFVIAVPVTTRSDLYVDVDGLFINTVLFRVKVNKDQTIGDYVKYISEEWLKTLCHSRYPLDQIATSIRKEGSRRLDTFCSMMLNFTTQYQSDDGLRIGSKHAKMPISINIVYEEKTKTYKLVSEWSEGLIDDGIAERLSDTVVQLSSKGHTITGKLFEIELLSPLELELLRSLSTNHDCAEACQLHPVYKVFEDHAVRDPTATALFFDGNYTSYFSLNLLSSRIANFLCENLSDQVLKRSPVVILMKRDLNAVASILGIWKAGGHFLPVALSNETCLKDVLERQMPAALLYNVNTATLTSISAKCPKWCVDDILKFSHGEDKIIKDEIVSDSKDSDIAYIIRTSGSTGKPKQCRISHQSLRTIAEAWKQTLFASNFVVNVLQWAPLSFDVFIGDIIKALVCVPGKLIICPDNRRLDIPHIRNLIRDQHATVFETTPQFGFQITNKCSVTDLESIKLFILGSDVLHKHVYRQIQSQLRPDQRLINSYGMTEATIDSSFFEGDALPSTRSETVPIGKPLPGVMMHILDSETLQPCPVGTRGELYISGDTLATGDVELVQMIHYQSKALKTGDAACWLPTGDIELLGRLDKMVKVRGFRISTTEIENKIVDIIYGVKEAYVTPMTADDKGEVEHLYAYLVLEDGFQHKDTISHQHVCSKLKGEIPYYMLPDKIQIIQEVPLTAHGKVDKSALSKIPHAMATCTEHQSNASSTTILKLREWFAEALGLHHHDLVSNDLTFIEQGGHSLVLVRFWSLISTKSTFKVQIEDLHLYTTIRSLADFFRAK